MRETLRQLTVTLALPVALAAVWVVRGEPAAPPARESATAYRVELADLPLPTPERWRTPGEATAGRVARVISEDPTARHRRATLPNLPAPSPVDLAVGENSESEIVAAPSPRAPHEPPDAVSSAPLPALPDAPARVAAAPSAASHRPRSVPTSVASTDPAAESELPAPSATGSAAGKPLAETSTRNSVTSEPATVASKSLSTPTRISAPAPAPGLAQRDPAPVRSRGPVSLPGYAKGISELSPIVTDRVGIDESPLERFEKADGHAPLTPPGQAKDQAFDLSLQPVSLKPSVQLIDLPPAALENAAAPRFVDLEDEVSALDSGFHWPATPSKVLLMIPEPGSALLLGAALAALGAFPRQRSSGGAQRMKISPSARNK